MALNLVDGEKIKVIQNQNDISLSLENTIVDTLSGDETTKVPSVHIVNTAKQNTVLSGTEDPISTQGVDGDVYLQYDV